MKRINGDTFQLESGRRFAAHNGIIGLSPDLRELNEGYDGEITKWDLDENGEWGEQNPFTPEERRELADFMIALWEQYAREGLRSKDKE